MLALINRDMAARERDGCGSNSYNGQRYVVVARATSVADLVVHTVHRCDRALGQAGECPAYGAPGLVGNKREGVTVTERHTIGN